jgi:hypothetical protein
VKYLARDDISSLKAKDKITLAARLDSFNSTSLNLCSFRGEYLVKHIKSIVGRHFKILLQAAPFVLLDFLTPEKQEIWLALCKLTPFIFQTKILAMDVYLETLKFHIDHFLHLLIRSNAQWVNKPKVHMLLHLVESIRRFGPASLFATEKFESYNGVLRQASIHSNRLAPSRDLATTFDNFSSLKFLVSGGVIHHDGNNSTSTASKNVQDIFLGNPVIQRAMGYNSHTARPPSVEAFPMVTKGRPRGSKDPAIPPELLASAPCSSILEVTELQIAKHDHLRKGVYVVVRVVSCHLRARHGWCSFNSSSHGFLSNR